jgi:hypothetical protein
VPAPEAISQSAQPTTWRKPNTPTLAAVGFLHMWRVGSFDDPRYSLACLLGAERPKIIRGYGGWGQSQRTGRRAVSTFDGSETPAYQVMVRLEERAAPAHGSIKAKARTLERLAGWESADDDPPPVLKWSANVPRDYGEAPKTKWVVEAFEWGESYATDTGRLVWQDATFTLGLYRDTSVKVREAKGFDRATLPKGRTLRQFARTHLDDAKRWRDVAELNRDNPRCPQTPEAKARRDVVLLVPPREG